MTKELTDLELLTYMRERLSDPEQWTQHYLGRKGEPVCLIGSAYEAVGILPSPEVTVWESGFERDTDVRIKHILDLPQPRGLENPYFAVSRYNDADGRTHDEILARLDEAIERVKAQAEV